MRVYTMMLPGASCRARVCIYCYLGPHAGVPATVVSSPQLDPPQTGHRKQHVLLESRGVQRVSELLNLTVHE